VACYVSAVEMLEVQAMYEDLCRLLADNGARLVYTTNRSVGNALGKLKEEESTLHYEVTINEKTAFELAFTGSINAKRTACVFSTEGLYEALDPVMSSAYIGVTGGFLVLCIQETDEEITPVGLFSKLPLIISENPAELARSIEFGFYLSDKYQIPVLIQSTPTFGDERGAVNSKLKTQNSKLPTSRFVKDPSRWAATPKFRLELHKQLNEKTEKIREEFEQYAGNKLTLHGKTGIITCKREYVQFYEEDTSVLYLSTIYPLPLKLVDDFIEKMDEAFILEGEYPAIELQIPERKKVRAERFERRPARIKPVETMYGFTTVVRDTLGGASSISMAHGIKKLEPEKKVLAITFENHFLHSGMPAFVNTLYNNSAYVLLVLASEKEAEISKIMEGSGFTNFHHLDNIAEVEKFKNADQLTVLFCKGII
jgi:TPP-dependent indolepyruvate ferredoxin oxidoreductase alpha subunit